MASEADIKKAYQEAMFGMARLNKTAAKLMHRFNAHAATDVTGFGLLGHAKNLAGNQKAKVSFIIESLPIYMHMTAVAKASPINFKLLNGYSAETSGKICHMLTITIFTINIPISNYHFIYDFTGGLLIAMTQEDAESFCKAFQKEDGHSAWIIGKVVKGTRDAVVVDNVNIIEV